MIGIRHPPPVYTGLKKSVLDDALLELRRMLCSVTTGELRADDVSLIDTHRRRLDRRDYVGVSMRFLRSTNICFLKSVLELANPPSYLRYERCYPEYTK